tara:strand:- start:1105 stop:1488 length:384 start_codon:yes stop_codon:yes gene_type:complete
MRKLFLSIVLVCPFMANASLQIFTLDSMHIIGAQADQVCVVNGTKLINHKMNAYLQTHGGISSEVLTSHFHRQLGNLSQIAICQGEALRLGVQRLPAIVVDEKYVVYGVSNVEIAKAMLRQWRDNHE